MESQDPVARIAVLQLLATVLPHLSNAKAGSNNRAKCAHAVSKLQSSLARFHLEEGSADTPCYATVRIFPIEPRSGDLIKQELDTLKAEITNQTRMERVGEALVWKIKQRDVFSITAWINLMTSQEKLHPVHS
jgi:hypothetical protein